MSWEQLGAEYVDAIRWWTVEEIGTSDEMFAPHDLGRLVTEIIADGPPAQPLTVGV